MSAHRGVAQRALVDVPEGEHVSLSHFMLLKVFQRMRRIGTPHARVGAR
jgi:hypothetical protein